MKTTHFALVLALLAPAAACSGTSTNVPTSTAQQAATKAPLNVQVEGPLRTIADSFAEVPLRPDQRSEIESLMTASQARHAPMKPLIKDVVLTLADQIEKGTLDEAALQTKVDAALAAMKPIQAEDRKAIQRAHDLLDKDQRDALVSAMESKRESRFGKWGGGRREGFGKIAEQLNLTADQKAKIFDAMHSEFQNGEHPNFREFKERHEKAMDAFKADSFNVDRDMPQVDMAEHATKMLERGTRIAKTVLPILTPDQRTTAAKLLRDRAESMPFLGGPNAGPNAEAPLTH